MKNLDPILLVVLAYVGVMSVIAVIAAIYDKIASKTGNVKLRVPEKRLLLFGLLGGALAEWLVMLLIRHKTKHWQFMFGLPAFAAVHLVLIALLLKAAGALPL